VGGTFKAFFDLVGSHGFPWDGKKVQIKRLPAGAAFVVLVSGFTVWCVAVCSA
jgi:hypothetical protein